MPKFRVELERKLHVCAYTALEVEARNEAEAKALALVRAQDGVTEVGWELDTDDWWDSEVNEGDITVLPDAEEIDIDPERDGPGGTYGKGD